MKVEDNYEDELIGLPFTGLKVSSDGAWLAVSGTGNHVLVYSLDSMSLHWKLPTCSSRITSLAFPPSSTLTNRRVGDDSTLVLSSVDNKIHVYDVEAKRLADWSRENSENFPTQLRFRSDPVVGLAFRPEMDTTPETMITTNNNTSDTNVVSEDKSTKQSLQVVLRSHGFLCFVDLGAPIPSNARIHPPSHLAAKNDVARRLRHIEQKKRQMKMTVKMLEKKKAKDSDVVNEVKRLRSNSIGSEASLTDLTSLRERSDSLNSEGPTDHASLVTSTSTVEEEEEVDDFNRNFAITLKYRPVIFADYLSHDEMVVVEEPWLKIMNKLPDPLFRQKFGT